MAFAKKVLEQSSLIKTLGGKEHRDYSSEAIQLWLTFRIPFIIYIIYNFFF
jgi:hypothetical protein